MPPTPDPRPPTPDPLQVSRPLLYVAYPMRLDLMAANAIQTHSTVRELQRLVPEVRLVIPRWLLEKSAFDDLDPIYLPRPAINKLSRIVKWAGWSYIERTLYSLMLVILLMVWRLFGRGYRLLYVRDAVCAAWLSLLTGLHGVRVIYEVHDLEALHPSQAGRWPRFFWTPFLRWLDMTALQKPVRLVSLTETFRGWASSRGLRPAEDIAVVPDAFDPSLYAHTSQEEARQALGLPPESYIIAYAGLTFAYRRLDLLVEAFATIAPQCDNALLALIGGREDEVAALREQVRHLGIPPERVLLTGQVQHEKAALYLQAADLLVIPDTVTQMTASPLKLFEYMAAGKVIVLKDMPALREILDDNSAIFFPAGDSAALAKIIKSIMDDTERAKQLAANALALSRHYTYQARAERILDVVRSLP